MSTPRFNELGQLFLDSPQNVAQLAEECGAFCRGLSWTGELIADTLNWTRKGNPVKVPIAEKMLDRITADLELTAPEWIADVAGAFPDVPAFLAGQPECMRRRVLVESNRAPVRVFVDVASSAAINFQQLATRGTAALALVMSLIREGRAVELFTYTNLEGSRNGQSVVIVKMLTTPIDIGSVAHCLTSSGYSRTLIYQICRRMNGFKGHFSKHSPFASSYQARQLSAREHLLKGIYQPGDIVLPIPFRSDPEIIDPVKWVNDRLAECRAIADEE